MGFRPIIARGTQALIFIVASSLTGNAAASGVQGWNTATAIPGFAQMVAGKSGYLEQMSCNSPGDCSAIGQYLIDQPPTGDEENALFGVTEVKGKWGKTIRIPGQTVPSTVVPTSLSCSSPGNCGAVAYSIPTNLSGNSSWTAVEFSETKGTWGPVEAIPGPTGLMTNSQALSISCKATGDCSAVGYSSVAGAGGEGSVDTAFVVSEEDGTWNDATSLQGFPTIPDQLLGVDSGAQADAISCSSPGNCSAGGSYSLQNDDGFSFVVNEVDGSWGNQITLIGATTFTDGGVSQLTAISCTSNGNCSAGGSYAGDDNSQGMNGVFAVSEVNGSWGDTSALATSSGIGTLSAMTSISCAASGNCTAGGAYDGVVPEVFVVTETNGTWGAAEDIPGLIKLNVGPVMNPFGATLAETSCSSSGNCAAGGSYTIAGDVQIAFVAVQQDGIWGAAHTVPGVNLFGKRSIVSSVSCLGNEVCVAIGTATSTNGASSQIFTTNYGALKPTKNSTITCVKGKSRRKVTGHNPRCPSGYRLRK